MFALSASGAYSVAIPIPRGRQSPDWAVVLLTCGHAGFRGIALTMKLDHAEVWHALQLLHGKPLTPWPACSFTVDGESGDVLAYLADFRVSSITRLDAWLAGATAGAMLYSWAPERLTERIGGLSCLPIPQYLRARFGR